MLEEHRLLNSQANGAHDEQPVIALVIVVRIVVLFRGPASAAGLRVPALVRKDRGQREEWALPD